MELYIRNVSALIALALITFLAAWVGCTILLQGPAPIDLPDVRYVVSSVIGFQAFASAVITMMGVDLMEGIFTPRSNDAFGDD